ncbi:BnaA09g01750D [Brassica napus]|uniref:BnaA09g01750D protein n=1 Tax=Brassica napus TaxID=3708 RepID=A0A078IGS2_BRANA|nr:BnaA09g01750D [Brassica napus]
MIAYCEFKKARIRAHAYFYIIFTQVCIFYTMSGNCEASLACSTCHVIMMMIHNTTKKNLKNQQMMRMICLILLSGSVNVSDHD